LGNRSVQVAFLPYDVNDLERRSTMSRLNAIFIALGSVAIAGIPLASSHAQSPASTVDAQRICRDYGVRPGASSYDSCVTRAAWAYDRGEPSVASLEAQRVSDAGNLCQSYGIAPYTMGYRECVAAEIDRRSIGSYEIRYVPSTDRYGFYYDVNGNLRDRNGGLIRAVPLVYR
jgi:hypothetical protein